MKICQVCDFVSPAHDQMGAERIVERLTKGLVDKGHEVCMWLNHRTKESPVVGAQLVNGPKDDIDVYHFHGWDPYVYASYGKPWVTTIHGYALHQHHDLAPKCQNIIAVSQFAAGLIGIASQFVWNCSEGEPVDNPTKDYVIWLGGTDWGESKGLFSTIELCRRLRQKLIVAGTGKNTQIINEIRRQCNEYVQYVGAVNGEYKQHLLQNAKALVLLTQLPDACPCVVSEAMMVGCPIVGSDKGSMPELIQHEKTGFICRNLAEAARAIAQIDKIDRKVVREYAEKNFSISVCTDKYLEIYNRIRQ